MEGQENMTVLEPVEEIGGNLPATDDNTKGETDNGGTLGKIVIGLGAVATIAYIGYRKFKNKNLKNKAKKGEPENEGQEEVYDDDLDDEDIVDEGPATNDSKTTK